MPFSYIFHAVTGNNDHMIALHSFLHGGLLRQRPAPHVPQDGRGGHLLGDTSFVVNVEELLKYKPDVVFQWNYMTDEIEKMEAAGIKVIALQYGTLDDLEPWIRIISTLYQQEERDEKIIAYFHQSIKDVADKMAAVDVADYPSSPPI